MGEPKRIRRQRAKDWRTPEGAVYVGRPTPRGNPRRVVGGKYGWMVQDSHRTWYPSSERVAVRFAAAKFRRWLKTSDYAWRLMRLEELRGKDLVCWCALDQACHADVLLDMANDCGE
jgi:hypothetical protein